MRTSAIILLATILALGSRPTTATDGAGGTICCDQCGRHVPCVEKTCQVVCEIKKETRTCWCVECQEICPLMPGCHRCCHECPPPRCGHPRCAKKLVGKEYQVEVPVYKCVVRHLCPLLQWRIDRLCPHRAEPSVVRDSPDFAGPAHPAAPVRPK